MPRLSERKDCLQTLPSKSGINEVNVLTREKAIGFISQGAKRYLPLTPDS